jgi:hypothetical protein
MFPAFAFEHAHGLAGLGIEYLTKESWDRITARAKTVGFRHLRRLVSRHVDTAA